ncbi:hypothetical protein FB565_007859 [Actinoplanes lutulentus]|uniref:Uncharacterized protein n=1 Tax=Actinoplanes lutulentus TaxID=1287878 RepID=A0A327ZMU4_9ACTN|nr:hypothetical protein [Actinoplanes lutulentus]MBB2948088.1 hypothetical protein [Actinoplanes lutulentus]RAK40031.1 hypothetical protein B0I29_10356 [Actinoplanes lutulentus]
MTFPPGDPWGTDSPPPSAVSPTAAGPVIVQIAEIEVTSSLVRTPVGDFPLAGSHWQVTDHWYGQRRTPTWAKLFAFIGICLTAGLSLLLLLYKETVPQGTVHVTVMSGTRQYVARVKIHQESDAAVINQQVNYVRSLAAL